jgi:hypothetical protein
MSTWCIIFKLFNGNMMKYGGKCENVKLQMGDYQLKSHLFMIEMDGMLYGPEKNGYEHLV